MEGWGAITCLRKEGKCPPPPHSNPRVSNLPTPPSTRNLLKRAQGRGPRRHNDERDPDIHAFSKVYKIVQGLFAISLRVMSRESPGTSRAITRHPFPSFMLALASGLFPPCNCHVPISVFNPDNRHKTNGTRQCRR